jgi:hypothetical protein
MMMTGRIFDVRLISLMIIALLPCFGWAASSRIALRNKEVWSTLNDNDMYEISSDGMERKLAVACENGAKPKFHYFEVIVNIHPDANVTGVCTLADQIKLGTDINKILSSHVSSIFDVKTF